MQLIKLFVSFIGAMPFVCQRLGGWLFGLYLNLVPNRSARVTRLNIELAFPELPCGERARLARRSLLDLGDKFFRLIATWIRPISVNQSEILEVEGLDAFLKATHSLPTLILLPHIGNWELFGNWLNQHRPYTAMFRPSRIPEISEFVRQARERGGNTLVPASTKGVKLIFKRLKQCETAILLPDQVPKNGEGTYVNFFGQSVLTPVLPYRLAKATKARIFLGSAIRAKGGFRVALTPLQQAADCKQAEWLHQMNLEIEALVRKYPNQYQWEYSRFRNAPDGSLRYD